ncbi:hypothetical protein BOTBODRAFT_25706 [Botryobasidium botryosum FD-172 SS1]|uniref:allantoicase n=1 Tax=Botryobasidium botryosum (strain FD-172 SS1) TaxID=930990 RepID=A0A067MZX2_BOTB1|nr:hypothetical protein BOTBODRAFT_25706 [Botryobasidium botryosum FD-172 SS1]
MSPAPHYDSVPLDDFASVFGATCIEISSVALGGKVVSVSDEFFAEASNLLKVPPAVSLKGQFGPKGALFDGWESRRHNPTYDWCCIKFGCPSGYITGFDIDTANFSGNEAPAASVQAMYAPESEGKVISENDSRWVELLPKVPLGPSSRHLFKITQTKQAYTHVKLNIYPDGGVGRFRVYGNVAPQLPPPSVLFDLAYVFSGARVILASDQHYGVGANLLLPGRGVDMGDGWETKRSRTPGHKDWVIIRLYISLRLADAGHLQHTEIDTAHFKGNFPESCEFHALRCADDTAALQAEEKEWTNILPRTKLGPHKQHFFQLENIANRLYTHVKVTIYPDGGIKRIRIIGTRDDHTIHNLSTPTPAPHLTPSATPTQSDERSPAPTSSRAALAHDALLPSVTIPALPLTAEAYAPFGAVIQAYADVHGAPRGVRITPANQGTAHKFHRLELVKSSYPTTSAGEGEPEPLTGITVFRVAPPEGLKLGGKFGVRLLERHRFMNQVLIPMGNGTWAGRDEPALEGARAYLVVVAKNGADDKPDLSTLRAFVASTAQGISYHEGIWHHPLISLESTIDFACVETQIGTPDNLLDCEIVSLDEHTQGDVPHVDIPSF